MTVATNRICRTCPTVLENYAGAEQCVRCSERSEAVREALRPEPPPLPSPSVKARARSCATDGHHACAHFVAMYAYVKKLEADSDWCPICNVDGEDGEVVHQRGCALIMLVNAEAHAPSSAAAVGDDDGLEGGGG